MNSSRMAKSYLLALLPLPLLRSTARGDPEQLAT